MACALAHRNPSTSFPSDDSNSIAASCCFGGWTSRVDNSRRAKDKGCERQNPLETAPGAATARPKAARRNCLLFVDLHFLMRNGRVSVAPFYQIRKACNKKSRRS